MKPGSKKQDSEHEQLKTAVIAFLDVLGHPLLAGEHMPTTVAGLAASARGAYCSHCEGVGSIFPFPGDGSDGIPVDERVCPVCHGVRAIGAMSVCGFEPTEKEGMASRVIYKYPVPLQDSFELELPYDANICLFAAQGAHVRLWIEHSATGNPRMVTRRFRLLGTGHTFEGDGLAHVGSVIAGSFVWHLYEGLV